MTVGSARGSLWHEGQRLLRFCVIGCLSFLIYAGLYALQSRVIWITGSHTLENAIAVFLASIFNFIAHRDWTFVAARRHSRQLRRYGLVVISGMLLQSLLFWIGHEYVGWPDTIVVVVVAVVLALYTYIGHRLYTFATVV